MKLSSAVLPRDRAVEPVRLVAGPAYVCPAQDRCSSELGEPRMVKSLSVPRRLAAGLVLAGAILCSGCVERRYTLRTDPPGALAIVNGEEDRPDAGLAIVLVLRRPGDHLPARWLRDQDGHPADQRTLVGQPVHRVLHREPRALQPPGRARVQVHADARAQRPGPTTSAIAPSSSAARPQILPKPRRGGILGWLGFP